MAETEQPQIYLVTPSEFELSRFLPLAAAAMDAVPVACLRLSLATRDEERIAQYADALRALAHERDIPLVIDDHVAMVERLGLDGVHLTDGARLVREARKALGPDAIVGAFCGASRHAGMAAGEAGADYVSFGPVSGTLGDGQLAEAELFAWWSQMIELPVVAEGGLDVEAQSWLAPVVDFLTFGEEIWAQDAPAAALAERHQSLV
ncbi:MAG: thiamine phosphate synthase [Pseudomonadota bacterium]